MTPSIPVSEAAELLTLADEYEKGMKKCLQSGYEEYGPDFERRQKLVINALRSTAATGSRDRETIARAIQLQARRPGLTDWVDIYPAQLEFAAKDGVEVRAIEKNVSCDREQIARIIDPENWRRHDKHYAGMKLLEGSIAWKVTAESLAKADAILSLNPVGADAISSLLEPGRQDDALAEMTARKDAAYEERNKVVAALARLFPSGTAKTDIPGWSPDWHGCVYIDLPTGQVSWHYHDSQAYLFEALPAYQGVYDGHDTEEKYRRLAELQAGSVTLSTNDIIASAYKSAAAVFDVYANDQIASKRWQSTSKQKELCDARASIWNDAAKELRAAAAKGGA